MGVDLVLLKKNGSKRAFPLPSTVTVIGRGSNCDLYIPLTSVSRKHCQLNCHEGALKIRDLGSRNGTYVNGKRVDEAMIKAGDYIKVGPLTFAFQINGQPENIGMPPSAAKRPSEKTSSAGDLTPEELKLFEELDGADDLDDFDPLEDSASD
jgi:pSer/pThr/pTyr-binding forkhead associated (FHA) protein